MKKVKYIDRVVGDLNACNFDFYGVPVKFDRKDVLAGVEAVGTEREQRVFSLCCEDFSLRGIGEEIGVTQERVRQILKKLERKLKAKWTTYYVISVGEADKIIRRTVALRTAELIKEPAKSGYSIDDFAAETNLSVRTCNCIMRAGVDTVEELTMYTPDEVIRWRNLGQKSFNELENALKQIGLSFSDKPNDKKPVKVFKTYQMEREKLEFLALLAGKYHFGITHRMRDEIKDFDPYTEYGGMDENRDIVRAWHSCVLMRNIMLILQDMIAATVSEDELIRMIKYAFVASKTIDYGLDYERAEIDFGIGEFYIKYYKKEKVQNG